MCFKIFLQLIFIIILSTKRKRYFLREGKKIVLINFKETYLPDLCEAPNLHGGNGYHQESGKVMI